MKNKNLIVTILFLVIVAGGAFFGGMKYQQSKQSARFRQFAGEAGPNGQRGGVVNQAGFRPVAGEIISSDSNSITVKLQDGSSKIVLLNDKTSINKAADATKDDLKVGETVSVFGQQNSDGSVTAQNIQLNPVFRNLPNQNQPNP